MKILSKIIIILFLFVSLAKAQAPQWRVYTPQNSGLPYPSVRSLAVEKDSMGRNIIWMGVGGLTKFDGLNWMVYNSSNSGMVGGAWTYAFTELSESFLIQQQK